MKEWGSLKKRPELKAAKKGHIIIACQSNLNELVGLARVTGLRNGHELMLKPVELIRAKIRPLKKSDAQINKILALKPGPIRTLYEITYKDAKRLIAAARKTGTKIKKPTPNDIERYKLSFEKVNQGAGFGSAKDNKIVEEAAMKRVKQFYENGGWKVQDVSLAKIGYDYECKKNQTTLHVEVKGIKGRKHQFIITQGELKTLKRNKATYTIALVTSALSKNFLITHYDGAKVLEKFDLSPIAYVAAFK